MASSDCLEQPHTFHGSHERLASDALTGVWFVPSAILLTKSGPLGTLILSRPAFIMQGGLLTHLKFENRKGWRGIADKRQELDSFSAPSL
ncbi:hypothetical protein JTE90_026970 [Oedothorax gibbosus]|uniref:Uncharacterized protein n=1 Tax=Oedothorax gibbosus TaxID=931172 RepID=A0AAV6TD01_9ARAC|nr:hypothetical protein JTE90_026970 [Oedothorax gibbosus]